MSKYIENLENVVSRLKPYLAEYLKEQGIDPSKPFLCFNPDHDDHNPSCVLIKDVDNPRTYCHACGAYFDILDCVSILEKKPRVGIEWVHDTLKYLCDKYKVELKVEELSEEQAYELDTYRAYRLAASLLQNNIDSDDERYAAAKAEVEKRTWNKEILIQEGIGTVLDYVEFRSKLKDAGFAAAFLDEIDLGRRDIFNSNNLIFPWRDEHGRAIGFTARNLLYETQKEEAEKENKKCSTAKYNNQRTTGLKCNIFQKGKRFYGIDKAIKAVPPLYIFEGQADAITARRYGLTNCVALAGSSLSTDHVILLQELKCNDIVLCLDSDETGQKKQAQILEEKLAGHQELRVRLIELPKGDDPDSFIRENGIEAFRKLTMWSAFEWRLNRFGENEEETEVCKKMVPFIANEHSPIDRESLCKILATRTGVSIRAINDELNVLVNAREMERSRERKQVLDKLQYNLQRNPEDAETLIYTVQYTLQELSRKHDRDVLSAESFVRAAEEQKSMEQQKSAQYEGFLLGDDLRDLQDALCGEWTKDVVMLFGGKENCFDEEQEFLDPASGKLVKAKDLILVNSLHKNQRIIISALNKYIKTGIQKCFRVTNSSGHATVVTAQHEFLTKKGWQPLKKLNIGDFVGSPIKLYCKEGENFPLALLLGLLIGDGNFTTGRPVFHNDDLEIRNVIETEVNQLFPQLHCVEYLKGKNNNAEFYMLGLTQRNYLTNRTKQGWHKENPLTTQLKKLGLHGHKAGTKFIPEIIFTSSKQSIANCLKGLFSTNGSIYITENNRWNIEYSSKSHLLIKQISHLLLRFGITSTYREKTIHTEKYFILSIRTQNGIAKFIKDVGFIGSMFLLSQKCPYKEGKQKNSTGDILWQKITTIEPVGLKKTCDIQVLNTNSFCIDGFILHNCGKSALLCKIGYELLANNNDVVVIYHTIDDTREQLLPRFVCIAEKSRTLTQNMVRNPVYWTTLSGRYPQCANILPRRDRGYDRILSLGREGSLIIKDMNDGMSLAFIDNLIMYHQDKNPDKKVVFIFDNLHKSNDFSHFKEERSRFKAISEGVKQIAGRRHIPFLSSVEYTKLGQGIKPANHNIGETVSFCYDANFIAHVYSEVADIPDKYTVCHRDMDWRGEIASLPRVELNIGKNKITDMKGSIYLDFWPASSDYRRVDGETVARDQEAMKQERRNKKNDDDPFNGAFNK